MQKNVASQKLIVFAFDSTTNLPKTGDATNITAYVSIDYGAVTVLGDTSATEMDATNAKGYYLFDLTQGETNGNTLLFSAKSLTTNIVVIGAPAAIQTVPSSFVVAPGSANALAIAGSNAATTFAGLTTGALACTTITASGAVAFQSTFAVTTSTALGAVSGTTLTLSGAVAFQSTFTVTGATVLTGNMSMAAGLTITQSTGNGVGVSITGNGTGAGFESTGGATGAGGRFVGGGTSGIGLQCRGINGFSGAQIETAGSGNVPGMIVTGVSGGAGARFVGGATGAAIQVVGGNTSGSGIDITTTSGHGINIAPVGTSMHGVLITGGNGGTSDGLKLAAGTGGVGFRLDTLTSSGTITFNALTVAVGTTLTGAVSLGSTLGVTGIITATAANDIRGVRLAATMSAALAELTGDPGATPTADQVLMLVYMAIRNLRTTTATADTIANSAGATILTAVLSDDGVTYTKAKYG